MRKQMLRELMRNMLASSGIIFIVIGLIVLSNPITQAQGGEPFHPQFALLDTNGDNVLESGLPISTMNTCGSCHDTEFIASHSFHTDVGLSSISDPGSFSNGFAWDISPGWFGAWNPLTYRYLSAEGDAVVDMTTPEWIQVLGIRHAGGGPAVYSRNGELLTDLPAEADNVETSMIDPETGESVAWDWEESGVVEMNCFLCHSKASNNTARVGALTSGQFAWANTATLVDGGIVAQDGDSYTYNTEAFDEDGLLLGSFIDVGDPTPQNCGQCHGVVHTNAQDPLVIEDLTVSEWNTMTTGQIFTPQKIANSGLNIEDKNMLSRSYDIHAERVVDCNDCHFSLNNPVHYREDDASKPDHLTYDPRRLDLSEYLERPLHQFAKGNSAQSDLAPQFDNTLRRCESCHDASTTHQWLPYQERHTSVMACETCHIPTLYGPAVQAVDWTVINTDSTPFVSYRGLDGDVGDQLTLLTGYEPVLLQRDNADDTQSLAPHNLITSWFWVYGDGESERPVPVANLEAVYLDGDNFADDVLALFDADSDGTLSDVELQLDTDEKVSFIAGKLADTGLGNPRIMSVVEPYTVNHNVTHGEWATKDCQTCHGEESRITAALPLSDRLPGGVIPLDGADSDVIGGNIFVDDNGTLFYQPETGANGLYIFGHDNVDWIDLIGVLAFLGVLAGISLHGGLRMLAARRLAGHAHDVEVKKVYMYSFYERLWHWLQTLVIVLLLFTGIVIHKPNMFSMFDFGFIVTFHNLLALILVINAFLAAFYHLVSGEIRQFLPEPKGFFGQTFAQMKYYMYGIFYNEPHPMQKSPEHKMNPLQQMTYLAILNLLLPAQVITGALMWGVQQFPQIANALGGLPVLAPLHTLVAWLFASFIIMHVYLTTTGHTPLANIKAMMFGWDDIEIYPEGGASDGESVSDQQLQGGNA